MLHEQAHPGLRFSQFAPGVGSAHEARTSAMRSRVGQGLPSPEPVNDNETVGVR